MKAPCGQAIRFAYLLLNLASLCLPAPLWKDRDSLMQEEKAHQTGGNLVLSRQEQQLSSMLVSLKKKEVATAETTGQFPPSMHFFRAKGLIDQSTVFSILKRMPKGRLGLKVPHLLHPPLTFCFLWQSWNKVQDVADKLMSCKSCLLASGKSPASELGERTAGKRKRGVDWMNASFQQL